MTEKKEKYGCLSKKLTEFLYLPEDVRKEKYGYGTYKMYERVIKNVDYAFRDIEIAFYKLPQKYRNKIDLITNYDSILKLVEKEELAEHLPDKIISNMKTQIDLLISDVIDQNPKLRKLARKDFEKVLDWLHYLEPENPIIERGAPS